MGNEVGARQDVSAAQRDGMQTPIPTATADNRTPPPMPPANAPGSDSAAGRVDETATADAQVTLRRRVLSPQTLISFGIAIAVLWFVVRSLDIDPVAIWAQVRRANLWLLAVAFILWYGAFLVRGWRWGH